MMTDKVACPERLPTVAVICVCPAATTVMAPPAEMVATAVADDDQVTVPVAIEAPF